MDVDKIPISLRNRDQWVLRKGKIPFGIDGSSSGWNKPENWMSFDTAEFRLKSSSSVYDGLGFVVARDSNSKSSDLQIIGGDFDCCRDPVSGNASPWVMDQLNNLNTYVEVSPSGCGFRWFAYGKLPSDRDSVFGNGPDDLTEDMKSNIIRAKPGAKKKQDKGDNPFNNFEVYEDGPRHLTVTGQHIDGFPQDVEHRRDQILSFLAVHMVAEETESARHNQRLPRLDVLSVIDTHGFTRSGSQLVGSHPTFGSTTGRNLVIDPAKNVWCYMHNGMNKGGDAWTWLAVESGAIDISEAGQGALSDPAVMKKTIRHAISLGLVPEDLIVECANSHTLSVEDLTRVVGRKKEVDDQGIQNGKDAIDRRLSPSKAASAILSNMELRVSSIDKKDNAEVWIYNGTIWTPEGDKEITRLVDEVAGDLSNEKGLKEILRRVRSQADRVEFNPNPYIFPMQDSVIDLKNGEEREAELDDYMTFKYNVQRIEPDYRPFLWFLCSSLPDQRDVLTVLDIVTSIAIREPFDTIVLLIGPGGNGKGVLEKVLISLFTLERTTAVTLNELKRSRFAPGELLDKDIWIVSEVETVKDAMSALKKISSGELLDSDVKYGQRVRGMPHALPVLDTNFPIDFGDNTYGRKRRLIKLDFPYIFGDGPDQRPIDRHLLEKLTRPEVLAGIVQIIKARAPSLIRSKKIYNRKSSEQMEDEYNRQRYSLNYFCAECLTRDRPFGVKAKLTTEELYAEYREYCRLYNITDPAAPEQLGKYISTVYNVQSVTTTRSVGGVKSRYRYYDHLWWDRTAAQAFGEFGPSGTTGTTEAKTFCSTNWIGETDFCNSCTTGTTVTTVNLLNSVIEETERMAEFISSCGNPRSIVYDDYLKNTVVAVVPVVNDGSGPNFCTTGGTTVTTAEPGCYIDDEMSSVIGPNPRSLPRAVTVRFLDDVKEFIGDDLKKPKSTRRYGPYKHKDVAMIPEFTATMLIETGKAKRIAIMQ